MMSIEIYCVSPGVSKEKAYHARYHTCKIKDVNDLSFSVVHASTTNVPNHVFNEDDAESDNNNMIPKYCSEVMYAACGTKSNTPANPWHTPEPPLADHVYVATFKGFQNTSLKHM